MIGHTRHITQCDICGKPLKTTDYGVHQWTSGWVKLREGGGGHGISCPERERRWAHGLCVENKSRGLINQGALFGGWEAKP